MIATASKAAGLGLALALAFASGMTCRPARSAEIVSLRIERAVPTVAGVRREPSAAPFYASRPTVNVRPSAGVYGLGIEPAPANGCEGQGGGFREGSGRFAGRCFGAAKQF